MAESRLPPVLSRFLADYGMSVVLLLLCAYYSVASIAEQDPTGADGGAQLARIVLRHVGHSGKVVIITRDTQEDAAFADVLRRRLEEAGVGVVAQVRGTPADAREALERLAASGDKVDAIAANQATGAWAVLQNVGVKFPGLGEV